MQLYINDLQNYIPQQGPAILLDILTWLPPLNSVLCFQHFDMFLVPPIFPSLLFSTDNLVCNFKEKMCAIIKRSCQQCAIFRLWWYFLLSVVNVATMVWNNLFLLQSLLTAQFSQFRYLSLKRKQPYIQTFPSPSELFHFNLVSASWSNLLSCAFECLYFSPLLKLKPK